MSIDTDSRPAETSSPTPGDPVAAARALGPLVRDAAEETESTGTMPAAIVDAFDEARLFWTLVPEELGGHGADIVQALEVFEEISRHDPSTGWSLMANACVTGFFAGNCTEGALEQMYRPGERTIVSGMFAPVGKAEAHENGFTVSGHYSFGSGSGHATWIGGGARFPDQNGDPMELIFLVPRENVEFKGNWDVLGLVGTGSYDYEIPSQFVSSDFVVRRTGGAPRRGQPTQRLGLQVIGSAGHAGAALGIGARALEELVKVLSKGKQRAGAIPVIEQQLFLHEFARLEGEFAAARAFCFDTFESALETVTRGDEQTELQYQRIRQASTHVTQVAARVVEFAYLWSGSAGLRQPSALGRCLRDMHGATQHAYVDATTLVNAAPVVIATYR